MKRIMNGLWLCLIIAMAAWLLMDETAAEPGAVNSVHAVAVCADCHSPWSGVTDENCLACHSFDDASELRPALRFHEERIQCLTCHGEHGGRTAELSRMDHTLLHPGLRCAQCHLDPHGGLMGEACRECHRISTWRIAGYRHPAPEEGDCIRCHTPPISHDGEYFAEVLLRSHGAAMEEAGISLRECGRCHVTHDWRHLRM